MFKDWSARYYQRNTERAWTSACVAKPISGAFCSL